MKVLYISSFCPISEYEAMFEKYGSASSHAAHKFNRLIIRGLTSNGCQVDALTQRIIPIGINEAYPRKKLTENGVAFDILPRKKNRKLNRIYTIFRGFFDIVRWKKQNPDGVAICDIILGEMSIATILARKFAKIKTVGLVTDVPAIKAGDTRNGIRAIPMKIKNAIIQSYDGYLFLTEQMDGLLNPKHKPYTVVEGVADENVLDVPNTLENKHPEKVCMMAGLLERVFSIEILLEAFQNVKCDEARLRFYGKGGAVPYIIKASETDSRIQYCGELTNAQIVEEEKKATFLVNPRRSDGEWTAYCFPSKNMEYVASGTPLVGCKLPCIPHEYEGRYYEIYPETVQGFTDTLQRLLDTDREEIHAFGLSAQKWTIENKTPTPSLKKNGGNA